MPKLSKNTSKSFKLEQTGSVMSFLMPDCKPVPVEIDDLISYVEEYSIHSTDIDGSELYDHLSPKEYFEQNEDKVCSLYFNRFILSNLQFLRIEKLVYDGAVQNRRVA